jgi:uncharacterized LabA/DUF88 family protein
VRVGVYIDGFNLYFGGASIVGAHAPGWKWLNMRSAFGAIALRHWPAAATIEPVVYCTARLLGRVDADAQKRQDDYLRALHKSNAIDTLQLGNFLEKVKKRPKATLDNKGRPVVPANAEWVTVADREEKGSDVNVASHLLIDTLSDEIDAAVVVSNDSDLAFAVSEARKRISVGIVNPNRNPTAAKLKSRPATGPGDHWEYQMVAVDLTAHQLPDPCHDVNKPPGW